MRITLLSAALLASGIASAATPVDGWYSSAFGGFTYLPENISITKFGLIRDHSAYRWGYNAGARIGYQSNPIRYEFEYTYLRAQTKYFNINNIRQSGISGYAQGNLAMANIYYDCPDMLPAISPFLGVGLGYAYVQSFMDSLYPFGYTHYRATNNVFAYQATVGLTYNFAENYAANIAYRYVGTERASEFGKVFQAHLASVGVIYRFDQANYK